MSKVIYLDWFTRESVQNDPDYLYIFTDNLKRGSGSNLCHVDSHYKQYYGLDRVRYPNMTQAVIRGLPNAFPISTMKDPHKTQFTMDDYEDVKQVWKEEVDNIKSHLPAYKGIKCSDTQFGNGRYSRIIEIPELFNLLNEYLLSLGIDNLNRF